MMMGIARRSFSRPLALACVTAGIGLLVGCSGSGGGSSAPGAGGGGGQVELEAVHFGRLADVYGLRKGPGGIVTNELFQRDVMVGPDIQDERDSRTRDRRDDEITFDFISANPDDLQPRLLITREIGSPEFDAAFAAVSAKLRLVSPGRFGQDTRQQPFSVLPRNAAIQLTFSGDLGIDESFFVQRDAQGRIVAVKNQEAVQVLEIVGDPTDQKNEGDFRVIPVRYVVRGRRLILDPVLLGSEGLQYQVKNSATGLPASENQTAANIRLALALEGPLALPKLKPSGSSEFLGRNNSGAQSVVRDARSGNDQDTSSDIQSGFVRDPVPPKLIGEMAMYLEAVDDVDAITQRITLFKNDVAHRVDAGDVVQLRIDNGGAPAAVTEVIRDPDDVKTDRHVVLYVRRTGGLTENDPRRLPGYPGPRSSELEAWLVQNAPKAVVIAEYEAGNPEEPNETDDPRLFLTFTPTPLATLNGYPQVSPFAGAVVRFSKPMDLRTVKSLDTLFFATRPMFGPLGEADIRDFIAAQQMDPNEFVFDKYVTPHLVAANRFDENGSQTTLRLQPKLGFYLDDEMRLEDPRFARYYLHLLGGDSGVKDLSGNKIDFQPAPGVIVEKLVVPFELDTRRLPSGQPLFPNNPVVSIVRRFANPDEDEQPSYYLLDEVRKEGPPNEKSLDVEDLLGGIAYVNGRLQARGGARVSRIVDDLNQVPPPPQYISRNPNVPNPLRHCAESIGEPLIASATASVKYGSPLQNPLNPFGCHLQTVWREIDMSLSRTDPNDFNLDVEQMHWAPFGSGPISFDEFDRISLYLGHSEWRPEPCIGEFGALPVLPNSGLENQFDNNYVRNMRIGGGRDTAPGPHTAFEDKPMVIDANRAFTEPNGINRYMPLPRFQAPYFVWRDETVLEQGGVSKLGGDLPSRKQYDPYIISPYLFGNGRFVIVDGGNQRQTPGFWNNQPNFRIRASGQTDTFTDGLLGSIALPLLADFWVFPDSPDEPEGRGYIASGANGWQIALALQSSAVPNFRVYSAGRPGSPVAPTGPSSSKWLTASGGWNPINNSPTIAGDNTLYWVQADFLKRQTVVHSGFVEIVNPHRMPPNAQDPRLGPYFATSLPANTVPVFSFDFDPPLSELPTGTGVTVEFRGAGEVNSWYAEAWNLPRKPDATNFPLDPRKAGDAHIRKYDDRARGTASSRDTWTYTYNYNLTSYVPDPNTLMDREFTSRFAGPNETFLPQDVRYFNWRFVMRNNVESNPPVSPSLESFSVSYRFEKR